ncbi:YiiX/YebB-like N1pC/P60 family cysteine hydrolase [Labilibaculum sp.]|uniref:YiiX/YebB-like N1pC/P60 family cysteine hydrolase n=1 Tax=Labilibaculum sp. TaxID=2060723 RepID=UPI00356B3B2C
MNFFRILLLFAIICQLLACHDLQKNNCFSLERGDLLFQDLDSDSISDAIEEVTGGKDHLSFSHVGIVDVNSKGDTVVLEAISKGVCYTLLDSFFKRSTTVNHQAKVEVGRLKPEFIPLIPEALEKGKKLIGKTYDDAYVMGDSSYYCSELIYEIFKTKEDSLCVFELQPMTFKNTITGDFLPFWIEYYQKLGVEIPEGNPGLNPNGMSGSPNINMVYSYHSIHK